MKIIHLLTLILLIVFMEIKFTNSVLTNYTSRAAIPTSSNKNLAVKKNLIGKQLSFPTKVSLPAGSSKYISKNKCCRHISMNNCLEPPPMITRNDKILNKMSVRTLDEINEKNKILPKSDSSENEEELKKETLDSENYKIDRLPNNYHPLFPYDLIEIRNKKNEKI